MAILFYLLIIIFASNPLVTKSIVLDIFNPQDYNNEYWDPCTERDPYTHECRIYRPPCPSCPYRPACQCPYPPLYQKLPHYMQSRNIQESQSESNYDAVSHIDQTQSRQIYNPPPSYVNPFPPNYGKISSNIKKSQSESSHNAESHFDQTETKQNNNPPPSYMNPFPPNYDTITSNIKKSYSESKKESESHVNKVEEVSNYARPIRQYTPSQFYRPLQFPIYQLKYIPDGPIIYWYSPIMIGEENQLPHEDAILGATPISKEYIKSWKWPRARLSTSTEELLGNLGI